MASIFKSLAPSDYSVTPFPAYYRYSYTYESGSTNNSPDVQVLYGKKFDTSSGLRVANSTYELFDSVIQSFYSHAQKTAYGINETTYIPSSSVYVISITQDLFGEKVVPGSFSIKVGTSQSYDDGKGNLIASSSGQGAIVGRMFYDKGIAVFKPSVSLTGGGLVNDGLYIENGTSVNIYFTSSLTISENHIKVELNPSDYLYSINNPSVLNVLQSAGPEATTPLDLQIERTLLPYVTTLGFYNENNELLLVAKPSVPIQRTADSVQTFIVKFDT